MSARLSILRSTDRAIAKLPRKSICSSRARAAITSLRQEVREADFFYFSFFFPLIPLSISLHFYMNI